MTPFELITTITMLAVTATLLMLFFRYKRRAARSRRTRMMSRLGLDPGIGVHGGMRTQALMNDVRRRCSRCASEDLCERWLADDVAGDNRFCPNAHVFDTIRAEERPA